MSTNATWYGGRRINLVEAAHTIAFDEELQELWWLTRWAGYDFDHTGIGAYYELDHNDPSYDYSYTDIARTTEIMGRLDADLACTVRWALTAYEGTVYYDYVDGGFSGDGTEYDVLHNVIIAAIETQWVRNKAMREAALERIRGGPPLPLRWRIAMPAPAL